MNVDLPQPDGPISAVIWCLARLTVMSVTARWSP